MALSCREPEPVERPTGWAVPAGPARPAASAGAGDPAAPPGVFPHRAPGRPGAARRGALGPRLLARLLVILLAMTGLTVLGPVVPSADASPSACPGRPKKVLRLAAGELRVHGGPQHACAVTVAARPGPRRFMLVSLQPRGGRAAVDQGYFTRSAGPVRVYAKNRCVRAVGKISGSTVSTGWILC